MHTTILSNRLVYLLKKYITKKKLFLFIIALFIFSLLYKLGAPQLKFEEPRRTIIGLEMIISGDYIHPKIYGEDYYKKPPVFNWLIASSYLITGLYTGFSAKIVTVFFYLILMYLTYLMGSKYVSRNFGLLSALLVGVSSDMYFSFSDRAEIDIFYSTITLASIYIIFYFGEKKSYWPMYTVLYLLSAIGFLTKGIPSIIFPVLSVGVYLFYNKRFIKVFHPAHFFGIFLFTIVIATYAYLYADGGDLKTFVNVLFLESSQRTVVSNPSMDFILHILSFPVKSLFITTLPAFLFFPFLIRKNFIEIIKQNRFILFVAMMLVVNIMPYWLSPGAKSRYIYMLYPLFISVLLYYYLILEKKGWREKLISYTINLSFIIASVLLIAMPLVFAFRGALELSKEYDIYFETLYFLVWLGPLMGMILLLVLRLYNKTFDKTYRVLFIIFFMICLRILFNSTVFTMRDKYPGPTDFRIEAKEILDIVGDKDLFLYVLGREDSEDADVRYSYPQMQLGCYITMYSDRILKSKRGFDQTGFYIINKGLFNSEEDAILLELDLGEKKFILVNWDNQEKKFITKPLVF